MSRIAYIEPNTEQWLETFEFQVPIKVRFSETDAFGHVNNVSYFIYFEQARLDYFEELGIMEYFTAQESTSMVVTGDLHCHYLQPLYYGERIIVKVKTAKVGTASLDLHYAITDESEQKLLATCRGSMVHVGKQTEKSLPWPGEIKKIISNFESGLSV